MAVKGRSERRNWKWNNSTRSGINKISCDKNITNRNRQQMQTMSTIWWDSRTHHTSMSKEQDLCHQRRRDEWPVMPLGGTASSAEWLVCLF